MRALVSGGAGFIGSWLCEKLLDRGDEVICADNFVTGNRNNIAHLEKRKGFTLAEADVAKPLSISGRVDFIFHLASPASPKDFGTKDMEIMTANSVGTLNLLELAREKKAGFLLASTSEIYGDPEEHPQKESYWGKVNPIGPRSCYDESKRFAETLATAYRKRHGIDVKIARIFNTYGPRMRPDDGRIIPNFITQALSNRPLTVYGNGRQTRSLCYVTDLVEGIMLAAQKADGMPVNIGNPHEISVEEIANIIIELSKSKSSIEYHPLPQDDPARRCPDIARARNVLGWVPKTELEDGLLATIEYFRKL
jgi:nucleoside-diphosphate-sugar epimerase